MVEGIFRFGNCDLCGGAGKTWQNYVGKWMCAGCDPGLADSSRVKEKSKAEALNTCPHCGAKNVVWVKLADGRNACPMCAPTRTFVTGATRSNDPDRIDWVRMLSLPALRAYGDYMRRHRKMKDGSLRGFDNWKKGMPRDEVIESMFRHVLDLADGKGDKKDACCAIMFNAMVYLDSLLKG